MKPSVAGQVGPAAHRSVDHQQVGSSPSPRGRARPDLADTATISSSSDIRACRVFDNVTIAGAAGSGGQYVASNTPALVRMSTALVTKVTSRRRTCDGEQVRTALAAAEHPGGEGRAQRR